MPDRDSSYRSGGGGGSLSEEGSGLPGGSGEGRGGSGGSIGGNVSGSGNMGGGGALGNGCGNGAGGGQGAGLVDGVCRDFIRNVCKRGKRCRFRHPDFNEVPDLGVQKNEFVFCHDYQNKECMRANCRFVHGSKEDEDYYKKTGELPLRLRGNVAARLGLSPMDLPHSRGEVPICRDFLTGECQRGNKCKFRHVKKDFEYETSRVGVGGVMGPGASGMVTAGGGIGVGGGVTCGGMQGLVGGGGVSNMMGIGCPSLGGCRDPGISGVGGVGVGGMSGCLSISSAGQRRFDRSSCSLYDPLLENGLFDAGSLEASMDHTALQLKRRRLEGLRLADGSIAGHYELGIQAALPPRPLEYRFLEEENCLLRKRVEELKKQVSNLIATNEVLLDQNAQFRNQAKVMTLSTPAHTEQSLVPPVGSVSSYNHSIAQTHTTLSSAGMQPRPVTQQDLVVSTGASVVPQTNSAQPSAPPPHLNPDITPLSAALVQTIAQGMAPPVSMASVAVSVAPVSVSMSMAQPLPCITMSHATSPMVAYPIVSQSMRINTLPH
ncbi:zinc finger CCCH domain-containing protein 10 [Pleuronectes platessa]|uniref:zinc finger CCCH domain-containing protein 10 n=1 Tax=Pleuronectes platessa TaxID=8262 RepID=UPI00232A580D|nr:zinc finger CCCH domain-containing protein 10 [Pleuronectes platessa]XP_053294119.1 zinc finger CCCH domain-containing protein 10 [Pleuronectes platessa]XP_053294127.1 zinc finger CCCH domain-containing protein 10 [Pleuronectes platessa]